MVRLASFAHHGLRTCLRRLMLATLLLFLLESIPFLRAQEVGDDPFDVMIHQEETRSLLWSARSSFYQHCSKDENGWHSDFTLRAFFTARLENIVEKPIPIPSEPGLKIPPLVAIPHAERTLDFADVMQPMFTPGSWAGRSYSAVEGQVRYNILGNHYAHDRSEVYAARGTGVVDLSPGSGSKFWLSFPKGLPHPSYDVSFSGVEMPYEVYIEERDRDGNVKSWTEKDTASVTISYKKGERSPETKSFTGRRRWSPEEEMTEDDGYSAYQRWCDPEVEAEWTLTALVPVTR